MLMNAGPPSDVTATFSATSAIVAMLDRFFHYFAAQQHGPAVELWDLPALVLGDNHVHGPMSRPHLERLFAEAVPLPEPASLAGQRPRAGSRTEPGARIEAGVWVAERVARIYARWPEQRFGGFLRGVEATEFLVRIDEAHDPKIRGLMLLPSDFPRPFVAK